MIFSIPNFSLTKDELRLRYAQDVEKLLESKKYTKTIFTQIRVHFRKIFGDILTHVLK
jgi:hypothetical protein